MKFLRYIYPVATFILLCDPISLMNVLRWKIWEQLPILQMTILRLRESITHPSSHGSQTVPMLNRTRTVPLSGMFTVTFSRWSATGMGCRFRWYWMCDLGNWASASLSSLPFPELQENSRKGKWEKPML